MAQITDQTKWRRVLNHVAADLVALVSLAAGSTIEVTQDTATDLKALVTLAGLQGIIPNPITATRIDLSLYLQQNNTFILYTVPTGKVLFLDSFWVSICNIAASFQTVELWVRDDEDVTAFHLSVVGANASQANNDSQFASPAIEVPADYDICLKSPLLLAYASCGIHGWLEDV